MSKNKPLLLVERAAIAEDLWVVKTNSLIGYDHVCQTEGEAKGIAVLIANCLTKDRELIQTLLGELVQSRASILGWIPDELTPMAHQMKIALKRINSALALAGEQGHKPTPTPSPQ